jgi:hypothetical protein
MDGTELPGVGVRCFVVVWDEFRQEAWRKCLPTHAASCVNLRDNVILGTILELGSAMLFCTYITLAVFMPRLVVPAKDRERATVVRLLRLILEG